MSDHPEEPHHETVMGQRLARIIAEAAARMAPDERMQLWLECYRLLRDKLDKDTHPELCAVINALQDEVPNDVQASRWN